MFTCRLCLFQFVLDDCMTIFVSKQACICITCFNRETENRKPMPKELRREMEAVLATL